jgi:hypothetical protein
MAIVPNIKENLNIFLLGETAGAGVAYEQAANAEMLNNSFQNYDLKVKKF